MKHRSTLPIFVLTTLFLCLVLTACGDRKKTKKDDSAGTKQPDTVKATPSSEALKSAEEMQRKWDILIEENRAIKETLKELKDVAKNQKGGDFKSAFDQMKADQDQKIQNLTSLVTGVSTSFGNFVKEFNKMKAGNGGSDAAAKFETAFKALETKLTNAIASIKSSIPSDAAMKSLPGEVAKGIAASEAKIMKKYEGVESQLKAAIAAFNKAKEAMPKDVTGDMTKAAEAAFKKALEPIAKQVGDISKTMIKVDKMVETQKELLPFIGKLIALHASKGSTSREEKAMYMGIIGVLAKLNAGSRPSPPPTPGQPNNELPLFPKSTPKTCMFKRPLVFGASVSAGVTAESKADMKKTYNLFQKWDKEGRPQKLEYQPLKEKFASMNRQPIEQLAVASNSKLDWLPKNDESIRSEKGTKFTGYNRAHAYLTNKDSNSYEVQLKVLKDEMGDKYSDLMKSVTAITFLDALYWRTVFYGKTDCTKVEKELDEILKLQQTDKSKQTYALLIGTIPEDEKAEDVIEEIRKAENPWVAPDKKCANQINSHLQSKCKKENRCYVVDFNKMTLELANGEFKFNGEKVEKKKIRPGLHFSQLGVVAVAEKIFNGSIGPEERAQCNGADCSKEAELLCSTELTKDTSKEEIRGCVVAHALYCNNPRYSPSCTKALDSGETIGNNPKGKINCTIEALEKKVEKLKKADERPA